MQRQRPQSREPHSFSASKKEKKEGSGRGGGGGGGGGGNCLVATTAPCVKIFHRELERGTPPRTRALPSVPLVVHPPELHSVGRELIAPIELLAF